MHLHTSKRNSNVKLVIEQVNNRPNLIFVFKLAKALSDDQPDDTCDQSLSARNLYRFFISSKKPYLYSLIYIALFHQISSHRRLRRRRCCRDRISALIL